MTTTTFPLPRDLENICDGFSKLLYSHNNFFPLYDLLICVNINKKWIANNTMLKQGFNCFCIEIIST